VECRVLHHAVLTRLDAFLEDADSLLARVRARVRRRERGLHPDLLLRVAEELRHALGALDERERLLGLSDEVVRDGEVAQPEELVGGREAFLQRLEDRHCGRRVALLDEAACLEERVLRRRRRGRAAQEVRRLHPEDAGDVLERLHRRPGAAGLEHGDVRLRVLGLGELRLGQAPCGPQRADARADVRDHGGAHRRHWLGTLRGDNRWVNSGFTSH
jgi:hypothetical protein